MSNGINSSLNNTLGSYAYASVQMASPTPAFGTTTDISGYSSSQIAALTASQVGALTTAQTASISTGALAGFSARQIQALPTANIATFGTDQVAALSTDQLNAMRATQIGVMTSAQINAYIASGEPMGKAGAYGVQGRAAVYIEQIKGSYSGIMGLPVFETAQLLRAVGVRC